MRAEHARVLGDALAIALSQARQQLMARDPHLSTGQPGFYLEFELPASHQEALDSLEDRRKAIELVSVRAPAEENDFVLATVFVPAEAEDHFGKKIEQYRSEETESGKPKNQNLIARINDIRLAAARSLFTDNVQLFPTDGRAVWWEIWLRKGRLSSFFALAEDLAVPIKETLYFPERDVVLVLADVNLIAFMVENSDAIAELRASKDSPRFFLEMSAFEQADWARDLVSRTLAPTADAPSVCLLDSGSNRGHPLIAPALDAVDQHSVEPSWGVEDSSHWQGHGTLMSGVALYGDLERVLSTNAPLRLKHRLESVKILPPGQQNDPRLYGAITEAAIGLAEGRAPGRRRTICMAVTSDVGVARGRPTSWSAAIDKLSYGGGDNRRLIVLSAGNIRDPILPTEFLDKNDLAEAENPCQAWNAIVAGAFTDKVGIQHPDYWDWKPLAPAGELSPVSRTSTAWERQWPIRPDVVFEGGNYAHDGVNAEPIDDLQLISTHHAPYIGLFSGFGDTSAAAGQAANMCAQLSAERPELWVETIRGLLIHSAEWTRPMAARFAIVSKTQRASLLRRYGWGVPDLERALRSASNDATLMIEDSLIPFRRENSAIKTRDMNIHRLPWPREELLVLADEQVELRVTLSYYIEPNPGERGWTRRHRYASHALRFAVKGALEALPVFRARINRAAEFDEEDVGAGAWGGEDDGWFLGARSRDRGSIHSDIWRGAASDLAQRDAIGVFPVGGWWKEKPALQRWDRSVRYALLVTVRAPNTEIDLYASIATQLEVPLPAS